MNLSAEPGKGWQVLSGIGWAVGLLAVLYLGLAVAAATQTPQPWIDIALNSAACGAVVAGAAWGIRYARKPRRAGQWSQRKAREARREFFRRKASSFALVLLGYIALTGVGLFLLPWPSLAFRQGCLVVGLLWLLSWLFSMDNAEGQRMGALAERWTSERFRRLRGAGWRVVDRVVFEEGDVDHVGFGPDGVVAVQTKYSAYKGRFDGPSLARFVEQARWGARKIHLLLKSYGIDVEVRPLLVLWGPGTEARPRYAEEKGTPVLCTARRADWLAHLPRSGTRLPTETIASVEAAVQDFISRSSAAQNRR